MSATSPTVTKAQKLLLAIFGDPKPGFPEVGYPTELDVVSFSMWLGEGGDNRGANRRVGKDDVTVITNSLMVQWMMTSPEVPLMSEKNVKRLVRDVIAKAKPLSKFTREIDNEEWISTKRKSFLSTVDIGLKVQGSGSDAVSLILVYFW